MVCLAIFWPRTENKQGKDSKRETIFLRRASGHIRPPFTDHIYNHLPTLEYFGSMPPQQYFEGGEGMGRNGRGSKTEVFGRANIYMYISYVCYTIHRWGISPKRTQVGCIHRILFTFSSFLVHLAPIPTPIVFFTYLWHSLGPKKAPKAKQIKKT